jgi:hypothetical protein
MFKATAFRLAMLFAFGVLVGSLTVELAQHHDDTKMLFAKKLKCQTLSAAYEKKFDDLFPAGIETLILNTDYSPARHSCVSIVVTDNSQKHSGTEAVVDILTDQTLFVRPFSDAVGRRKDVDEAFQKSLRSAP